LVSSVLWISLAYQINTNVNLSGVGQFWTVSLVSCAR
jgi:hypothetical protein